VFGRGLERRAVFGGEGGGRKTERDRKHFLELLAQVHERCRMRIHAYALSLSGRTQDTGRPQHGWRRANC
jgi:hypothetical protein